MYFLLSISFLHETLDVEKSKAALRLLHGALCVARRLSYVLQREGTYVAVLGGGRDCRTCGCVSVCRTPYHLAVLGKCQIFNGIFL